MSDLAQSLEGEGQVLLTTAIARDELAVGGIDEMAEIAVSPGWIVTRRA